MLDGPELIVFVVGIPIIARFWDERVLLCVAKAHGCCVPSIRMPMPSDDQHVLGSLDQSEKCPLEKVWKLDVGLLLTFREVGFGVVNV